METLNPVSELVEQRLIEMTAREKILALIKRWLETPSEKNRTYKSIRAFCSEKLGYGDRETREILIKLGVIITQDQMTDEDPKIQRFIYTLRNWRTKKALALDVAPFVVLSNRTLMAIARSYPINLDQLALVPGVGEAKIRHFGQEIVDLGLLELDAANMDKSASKLNN